MCHTYHRSRGASIACVDELLKEITSGVTFEQANRELPVIAFDFAFLKTSQGS